MTTAAIGYAAQNKRANLKPLAFERRELAPLDVRIDIAYCGVCHSDIHQVRNEWDNTVYPCLPGHEIAGRVAAVGSDVTRHSIGDIVAVGCMVDSCHACTPCRQGLEQYCEGPKSFTATYNGPNKPDGSNTFGGYSNTIVVREDFVLKVPPALVAKGLERVAPLLCAGVTTFSPLRHWNVGPGQKVGIVGFGGLGHVATQLAKALGAEVVVFTTSPEKAADARRLGASDVVVSTDKAAMAQHENTLHFILSTIPDAHDINPYVQLLKLDGTLTIVGELGPFKKATNNQQVAFHRRSVAGSLIGGIPETQEVLDFCAAHDITAQVQVIAADDLNDAFDRVTGKQVRYRYVLDMATLPASAAA